MIWLEWQDNDSCFFILIEFQSSLILYAWCVWLVREASQGTIFYYFGELIGPMQ